MDGTEEDTTDNAPQENGDPAKDSGLDRSVNRAGTGDRGEMVTHQNSGVGRNEVLAVVAGVGRGFTVRIYAPLLGKPATIENVAAGEQCNRDDEDK
jgi:hypothetical protein